MTEPGRDQSRDALHKVEALLNSAKQNVAGGNKNQASQDVEDAYSTCEQMNRPWRGRIIPLIDSARSHMKSGLPDKTVEIDIGNALEEVKNIRAEL